MLGLLLWYERPATPLPWQLPAGLATCLFPFPGRQAPRLVDTGSTEMNLAPVHALSLLYRRTHETATWSWRNRSSTNLRRSATMGLRWQAITSQQLPPVSPSTSCPSRAGRASTRSLGLAELYRLTGQDSTAAP